MNPRLERLQTYPFEKLARLLSGVEPPKTLAPISLSIGEPQHAPPELILDALRRDVTKLGRYPATIGSLELRAAAARWLERRFTLPAESVDPHSMLLPVNGTREALFGFVQAAVDGRDAALVAMPNPFLDTTAASCYVPDLEQVPPGVWERCQVLILCSPGNPTGAVLSTAYLRRALALAAQYDFVIAADECYAEIYLDEQKPPPSLLEAALAAGHGRFERCVVFHSLSKRSSVPGLRSGFVAGDAQLIARFLLYRTYQGGAMSPLVQAASIAAWSDDAYAASNRRVYREKFERVLPILQSVLKVERPAGAFYLWPDVGADDERFVRELYAAHNVTLLPGSYLARHGPDGNPGAGRVRVSLTASVEHCVEAAERIRDFLERPPP
jgi:N-succinyldiaminopimelate aminotransferase